ncbi:S-layer homology domain-containing protein [Candidatus Gracilibacteria bacterium]|nr:S-layer homology domain-containing protein [Candidatus Gracilibacteria bacterium]
MTYIEDARDRNYIDGYEDGSFRSEVKISREEFLKILFQVSGIEYDDEPMEECFPDVHDNMWSKKYICTAKDIGITQGFKDGTFRPYNTITTIEALAFISRIFSFEVPQENEEWYENQRIFFTHNNIFGPHLYTKNSLLSRGQATELLIRSQDFQDGIMRDNISQACGTGIIPTDSGTIELAGSTRNYILSLPDGYDANRSYPVIFGIHGRTNSNEMVQGYMRLENYPGGAIVVYPAGLGNGPYNWHQSENIDYFDALLAKISKNYCVKRDRVFVVGHSLGGYFTYKLGCLRGDAIRAISVVGGSAYYGDCGYPVATQILHREDDYLVLYGEGERMLRQFQEVNLCGTEANLKNYGGFNHGEYTCSSENPVSFAKDYNTLLNDPHGWPGGRSQFIFNFFESLK